MSVQIPERLARLLAPATKAYAHLALVKSDGTPQVTPVWFDFDGQNLPGWLYQIARHRVRDFRRLLWVRHLMFGSVPLSESLSKGGASPADSLETNEKRVLLERLLEKLNESERAAVVLFEIDGYSGEEIAEIQGVPVNTVWARIHKARKKLKASLAKHENREQKRP